MGVTVLGIDLGKNSCSIVGLDETGRVVLRRRMRRDGVVRFAERLSPCTVAMETCCGAHHLGRELAYFGHAVRLMSPEYVRPYVKAHKNDDRDAEAIAEAATRPTMRFVEIKSEEQLDLQTLHRSRSRLVSERTALINQLRAILLERGIVIAQGRRKLEQRLAEMLADGEVLCISARMRILIEDMQAQWRELDRRIAVFNDEFARHARENAASREHSRGWRDERDGPRGGNRQCRDVRARQGSRGLARTGAAPSDNRREASTARDQQAREHLSANAADPRCSRRDALALKECNPARGMAAWPARSLSPEHRHRGVGEQACPDCLGSAPAGVQLQDDACTRARWPDSRPVSWNPDLKN